MKLIRKIGINIIIAMLSIENIMFLNYKIAGLDIVDIGVIIGFIFVFYSSFIKNDRSVKCSKYIFTTVGFTLVELIFSMLKDYQFRYILPDIRNFLFMAFAYEIFRSNQTEVEYVLSIIPSWGLINSLVSLATFGFFTNNYSREIYTPLWISVFSIAYILFGSSQKNKAINYVIATINMITIILSQTRSYIIPVLIMFILYGIIAVKNQKFTQIILAGVIIGICILFLQNNGFYDMIIKRMTGSFNTESTVWLRFENSSNHIASMSLLDWIIGRGFGERFNVIQYDGTLRECSDLEMFVPNQLTEWGIIAFVLTYFVYIRNIVKSGLIRKSTALLMPCLVILIGGFVSGLVGMIGSVVLGIIIGMLSNPTGNKENEYIV